MRVQTLLASLLFGVLASLNVGEASAESRDCFTVDNGRPGGTRSCRPSEDWVQWINKDADKDYEFDCRSGPCDFCGSCHAVPRGYPKMPGTPADHVRKFTYQPKPGERITWAGGRGVLTLIDGRYCVTLLGNTVYCFAPGSTFLTNPASELIGVLAPAKKKK